MPELYDNMSYTYTWVLDISDPATWSIKLPYVSLTPFVLNPSSAGVLVFYVENELVASSTVSTSIQIPITATAGEDFEFVGPRELDSGDTSKLLQVQAPDKYEYDNVPRSDGFEEYNIEIPVVEGEIEFLPNTGSSVEAHQESFGDPVRSLNTVIKRSWTAFFRTLTSKHDWCHLPFCTHWKRTPSFGFELCTNGSHVCHCLHVHSCTRFYALPSPELFAIKPRARVNMEAMTDIGSVGA